MKYVKKAVCILCVFILCFLLKPIASVSAADTANISISSANGIVGEEIEITVTISASYDIGGAKVFISYDSSILQPLNDGGSGVIVCSFLDENIAKIQSKTLKFKIIGVGTSQLNVTGDSQIVGINDEFVVPSKSSGSVTAKAPVTYSSENRLSSLSISPGVLSPAFSEGVTSYTTSVAEDVEKLVVSAKPKDNKAKVSVSGTSLSKGANTVKITVTAENGSKKTYTIKVTRAGEVSTGQTQEQTTAPEDKKVIVNGIEYKVVNDLSEHPLPEGFEQTTTDIESVSVTAGRGVNSNLTIVYLESDAANAVSGFYIYDTVTKTFTLYNEISLPGFRYVILPITDGMEPPLNWQKKETVIDDKNVTVLMHESGNICVFYGIDSNGKSDWYYYDFTDKTVMRYFDIFEDDLAKTDEETSVKPVDNTKYIIVIAVVGVVAVISIVLAIVFALSARKNKKAFNAAVQIDDTDTDIAYDDNGDVLSDDYEEQDEFNLDEEYYNESETENIDDSDLLNEAKTEEVSELELFEENGDESDVDILAESDDEPDVDILDEKDDNELELFDVDDK